MYLSLLLETRNHTLISLYKIKMMNKLASRKKVGTLNGEIAYTIIPHMHISRLASTEVLKGQTDERLNFDG